MPTDNYQDEEIQAKDVPATVILEIAESDITKAAATESLKASIDKNDTDLFTTIMNKLQANNIRVTDSTEREKIRLFVESSMNKDSNVGLGYPAVENSPSATGIKYYLHLDYPKLKNSTANEHGAFCLQLDKSICSGSNSTCEVTYTGQSKCTFAYRLLQ